MAFALLVFGIFAVIPVAIDFCAVLLCAVFLAAAALRLLSVAFAPRKPDRAAVIADHELPIYTIICPLYREASVVGNLVAALRALDYPGIMAQTPQAVMRRPY